MMLVIKFLKLSLVFILVFCFHSKSYAIENYSSDTDVFYNLQQPYQLAANTGMQVNADSSLWFTSIIVPGLGQILMGDFLRGIKFTIAVPLLGYGAFALMPVIASAGMGSAMLSQDGSVSILVYLLIAAFLLDIAALIALYAWNITDSYIMSKELNTVTSESKVKIKGVSIGTSGIKFNLAAF